MGGYTGMPPVFGAKICPSCLNSMTLHTKSTTYFTDSRLDSYPLEAVYSTSAAGLSKKDF
jgi:hypothetical protein